MDCLTPDERAAHAVYHAHQVTNGIATVSGHIARLRDLNDDPERDATYRQMLSDLGELSVSMRRMHSDTTREAA